MFLNTSQNNLLCNFTQHCSEMDRPVISRVLLLALLKNRDDIHQVPVSSDVSRFPRLIKNHWEMFCNDICQLFEENRLIKITGKASNRSLSFDRELWKVFILRPSREGKKEKQIKINAITNIQCFNNSAFQASCWRISSPDSMKSALVYTTGIPWLEYPKVREINSLFAF